MNEQQLKTCQFSTGCRYLGVRDDLSYECLKKNADKRKIIDKEVYAVIPSLVAKPNAILIGMLPLGDHCEGI